MLDNNTIIKVRNRDNGAVGYTIPDLGNLHRSFEPGEVKTLPMEELRKLSYIPGGNYILSECLVIEDNNEAVEELLGDVEPEYFYTKDDVKNLLENGTLDEVKDCLDFAPDGTVELVKQVAVDIELNDIKKREAISEATGLDINSAIRINKESKENEEEVTTTKARRASTPKTEKSSTPARRTESKYKVVNK